MLVSHFWSPIGARQLDTLLGYSDFPLEFAPIRTRRFHQASTEIFRSAIIKGKLQEAFSAEFCIAFEQSESRSVFDTTRNGYDGGLQMQIYSGNHEGQPYGTRRGNQSVLQTPFQS